jgi:ABC-type multidrug transport system ATPase subunit
MERISIQQLTFKFGKGRKSFFNDVSVDFDPYQLNFIQGKNGSGKSTFFRLINGNVQPGEEVSGFLMLDAESYFFDQRLQACITEIPQNFDRMLAPENTFIENLICAQIGRYPTFTGLPKTYFIPDFIQKYNIDYNVPVRKLSGGQRQILSIVMALQKPTKLILLDEPTAALDEENSFLVMDFLKELCEKKQISCIIIVHDQDIIQRYAEKRFFKLEVLETGERVLHSSEI